MSKPNVAIVGSGNVGQAMLQGLTRAGYAAALAPREPAAQRAAVAGAQVVVFAIPFDAREAAVQALGAALDGKVLVDVTNPLKPGIIWDRAPGDVSGAEDLQRMAPNARVVKAFNTVFAASMPTGTVNGAQLSVFVASDNDAARTLVLQMARDMEFDPIDAGALTHAYWLEALLYLEMILGFKVGHGANIGWRFIHPAGSPEAR